VAGVGNEEKPLPDMGCAEARSAQIERRDGVTLAFHVSTNKVEPSKSVLACNLLAKDCARALLSDEPEEVRPEMALIIETATAPGCAEGLAGAGACPDRALVCPPCAPESVAPDPDTSEEVALGESGKVASANIDN
jgi:hypothetical protein